MTRSELRRQVDQSGVTVIDSHTVEIAGVRYRRSDLPPEGYEERQVDNLMSLTTGTGYDHLVRQALDLVLSAIREILNEPFEEVRELFAEPNEEDDR